MGLGYEDKMNVGFVFEGGLGIDGSSYGYDWLMGGMVLWGSHAFQLRVVRNLVLCSLLCWSSFGCGLSPDAIIPFPSLTTLLG